MPTNDETKSGAEYEQPLTDSVFDFLYSDSARIASLLAQFDPSGYVTGAETSDSREEVQGDKASAEVHLGSRKVFGVGIGYEGNMGLRAGEAAKLTYDPYWANARNLLNLLNDRLVRDLASARIGQIVAVSGHLAVADSSMLKVIWDTKAVQKPMREGIIKQAATLPSGHVQAVGSRAMNDVADAIISLVRSLPHLIQMRLQSVSGGKLWGTLKEGGLVGSAHDLFLKNGMLVPGEWTVLGVIDALPELDADGKILPEAVQAQIRSRQMVIGPFGQMLSEMTLPSRQLLGRPIDHHGVTPLMIFREVGHAGI